MPFRRSLRLSLRSKHGQRVWNPVMKRSESRVLGKEESKLGAAPCSPGGGGGGSRQTISGAELRAIVYRKLPMDDTVDSEWDLGHSVSIHREYLSPRARMGEESARSSCLAFSNAEMKKMQERIGKQTKAADRGAAISSSDLNNVHTEALSTDPAVNAPGGISHKTVRYLFDQNRLAYVDRFRKHMAPIATRENNELNALLEVCAVVYGCSNDDAREAWLTKFMNLDRDTLNDETEELQSMVLDAKEVLADKALFNKRVKTLADQPCAEEEAFDEGSYLHEKLPLPHEFAEFAPLYKSYAAFCRGESSKVELREGIRNQGRFGVVAERQRWRALVDKLVREDYDLLTQLDAVDAVNLSNQLQTWKLFDTKIGDIVQEAVVRQKQTIEGELGSEHRGAAVNISENHPDHRRKGT